ncbi:MAG: hypothetical protein KBT11_06525, partial [Treponema sp.]|nr:hypothetical protein [Candidatus Treponema equifaecale]
MKNLFNLMTLKLRRFGLALSGVLMILPVVSCGVGLGDSVDTEAPKIQIEYPPVASVIRKEFVLSGTWDDDKAVSSIKVSIIDTSSKKEKFSGMAEVKSDKTWSIRLNDFDESNSAYFNGWQFADGAYQVSVTAMDAAGHSTGDSRSFEIDNTPPVFVIQKPGVVKSSANKCSKYGSIFSVEGTIADDHEISKMDLLVYDAEGNLIKSEPYSETNVSTVGGTSVQIARYVEGGTDVVNTRYNEIYGDDVSAEDKIFYCTVTLSDSAKIYQNSEDNGVAEGNPTSIVYLYDDVYDEYMSPKKGAGLTANEFKKILNKTLTEDDAISTLGPVPKTVPQVTEALGILGKNTAASDSNYLKFSLNPNADPTYLITGYTFNSSNLGANKEASANQPLTAVISAGRDGTLIEPSKIKVWFRELENTVAGDESKLRETIDSLVKQVKTAEGKSEPVDFDAEIQDWQLLLDNSSDPATSDSSVTVQFEVPEDIGLNKYYIIVVTGHDKDDTYISQNVHYGFIGSVQGTPPSVSFTSPSNLSTVKSTASDVLSVSGSAVEKISGMYIKKLEVSVEVSDQATSKKLGTLSSEIECSQFNVAADSAVWTSGSGFECVYRNGENIFTVTPEFMEGYDAVKADEGSGKSYQYDVSIKAVSVSKNETVANLTVFVDSVLPVVSINSITPTVSGADFNSPENTYVNGTITVKGNVEETNLKEVLLDVYVDGKLIENFSENLGKIYSFSKDIDTTKLEDNKDIDIRITARDKVGNETVYSSKTSRDENGKDSVYKNLVILQETDRPVIIVRNASVAVDSSEKINTNANLFGTTSNNVLQLQFSDDDSVTQYKIYLYDEAGKPFENPKYESSEHIVTPETKTTTVSEQYVLPPEPGVYRIKIEARDWLVTDTDTDASHPNGIGSTGEFFVAVDTGSPVISVASPSNGAYVLGEFEVRGEVSPTAKKFENGTRISASFVDMDENVLDPQPADFTPVYEDGKTSWTGTSWKGKIKLKEGESGNKAYYVLFTATDKYGQSNSTTLKFNIDMDPPVLEPVDPTQTIVLSDTQYINLNAVSSDSYSGLSGVYYYATVDASATVTKENFDSVRWVQMNQGASSYNATVNLADLIQNDGEIYIWFGAADNANNRSFSPTKYILTTDLKIPEIKVSYTKGSEIFVNENEKINSNANPNEFKAVVADTNIKTFTCENENVKITLDQDKSTDSEKIYTVKVTNGDDDTQNVVLVAEDECGKKKEFAFSVTCDTVPPVVVVDEYAESIGTNSFTLTGTVYEKNLKDINFCLKNDDSSKNKTATVTTTLDPSDPSDSSGNTRKFTAKFFEVTDGDYNVTLLVDDMFGNKTETASKALNDGTTVELKPVNFDSVSPVSSIKLSQKNEYKLLDNSLSHAEVGGKTTGETDSTYVLYEENPAPANRIDGNLYTNAENEFVLSGTIVEGNFNSATISLNGADPLNLQNDEGDLTAEGEWKYEQKKKEDTEFDGSYRYTITVLDKAGHKFEKTFTVIVDTKAPDFEITSPVDQQSFSNAPEIKGTWSDDGIGIKNLTYAVYNITETSTLSDSNKIVGITENRGAATWSLTLPDSFKDEGTFKVVASANDYFGKECDSKESVFYYDTQNPELTEKLTETGDTYTSGVGENGRTTNASFSLAGTVSDTNALFGFVAAKGTAEESVVIKTIVIGEEKTYTAKTVASNKHSADWNYDFVVGDENNTAKNYLPDGNYTFTVIAKDIAGKTYQLSRTVRVDTEAPKFGNGPADSKDTSYDAKNVIPHVTTTSKTVVTDSGEKIWYNTTDLRIAGTASDNNGTGIAGVYYETSTDGSNWSGRADMAGSTSWSGTISGLESTKTRVKITVTDNAGNSLPKELGPWNIDTTKPALSENSVMVGVNETLTDADKKSSILANGTKDIYLSGKVEDEAGGSGIAAVYILPYNSTSYADKDKAKVTADGTFTFTIPMADIKQSGSVYARIFDGAGNYSDANLFSINFDNVAPTVKMNNPKDADNSTDGIQVNGIISIEGTASDNNTLQKIERIECSTDNGTNWKKLVTTAEFNDLSDKTDYQDAGENFAITGSYSWTASGIDTTKFTDNSTVKFRAVALDTAENEGWYEDDAKSRSCEIVLNINQNTDRPTVKVTSINKIGSEYFLKYGTNAQISGSISDDDSTSSNVVKVFKASDKEIELDADGKIVTSSLSGETTFTETTGEWTFQPSDIDDGSKTVYFYMEDNAGKVFVTASSDVLSRPYFQYKTDTKEDNETSVSYKSDSKSPVIADTNANDSKDGTTANKTDSADNVAALMASYVVGGSEKKHIRFNIKATDASGIAGIAYNLYYTTGSGNTLTTHYVSNKATNYTEDGGKKYIGGVELAETSSCIYVLDNSSYTAEGTEASWTTGFVDISSVPTGSITLNVTPYDKAGLTGNQSYTFAVDNSGPTIKINAPIKNSQVTGEFAIEGSAIDSGSASTENIQWLVPSKAELTIANAITSDSTRFEYLKTLKWNGGERSLADGATVSSWKFEFDGKYDAATSDVTNKIFKAGNPKFDVYDSESYATNTDYASTGLYYLPVYFMAT